jgi:glycosyltransferase involved in cell wall biosynthesis
MKVWLLTNQPSPYQAELFAAVERLGQAELEVRFMRRGDPQVAIDGFRCRVMKGLAPAGWRDEVRLHPRAIWEAMFGRYDCYVLSGLYTSITFLICALVLILRRRPWAAWLERPRPDARRRQWSSRLLSGGPLHRLRNIVLRTLLKAAWQVIAIGSAAAQQYRGLGVAEEKLRILPYCCDIHRFRKTSPAEVAAIRRKFGLDGKIVFLYSGQMIERKGVDVALRAFERLAAGCPDAAFLLLGDGPSKARLEQSVAEAVRPRVHFAGRIAQAALPDHFAAADVFVFPSRHDGWAVVINEACAAGLPVVSTSETGAAHDLVEPGRSGFLVGRDDVDGLAEAMEFFVRNPEQIAAFGLRSRELVKPYSAENGAKLLHSHLSSLVSCPAVPSSVSSYAR